MPTGPRPDPPTRTAKAVFFGIYGSVGWRNIMWLHLDGSGEIASSELLDLATKLNLKYAARFMPLLMNTCFLQGCQVVLYAGGGDTVDVTATTSVAGSKTSGTLPASVAACITWKVLPHYRGGHPRTYLCGISGADITTPQTFAGSFITAAGSAAAGFHTDVEGITTTGGGITGIEHGVISFVRNNAWREPPVFYRFNSSAVDARIDSQRRRLGRDVPA